jgi:hypothetical protein
MEAAASADRFCSQGSLLLFGMSLLQRSRSKACRFHEFEIRKIRSVMLRANGCGRSIHLQDQLRRNKSRRSVCSLARIASICFSLSQMNFEYPKNFFLMKSGIQDSLVTAPRLGEFAQP